MRPLSWRFWVAVVVLTVAWILIGLNEALQLDIDPWIYRIGLSGTVVIALMFLIGWTVYALAVPKSTRWWRTDLGAALVITIVSFLPGYGALAWVFDFGDGDLREGMLAWAALAGPLISMISITWCAWLWMLTLNRKRDETPKEPTEAESQS